MVENNATQANENLTPVRFLKMNKADFDATEPQLNDGQIIFVTDTDKNNNSIFLDSKINGEIKRYSIATNLYFDDSDNHLVSCNLYDDEEKHFVTTSKFQFNKLSSQLFITKNPIAGIPFSNDRYIVFKKVDSDGNTDFEASIGFSKQDNGFLMDKSLLFNGSETDAGYLKGWNAGYFNKHVYVHYIPTSDHRPTNSGVCLTDNGRIRISNFSVNETQFGLYFHNKTTNANGQILYMKTKDGSVDANAGYFDFTNESGHYIFRGVDGTDNRARLTITHNPSSLKGQRVVLTVNIGPSGDHGLWSKTFGTSTETEKTGKWMIVRRGSDGSVVMNGVASSSSDKRLKDFKGNINTSESLTILRQVPLINFTYKNSKELNTGVFAQDVRDVLLKNNIPNYSFIYSKNIKIEESVPTCDISLPEEDVEYSIDYTKFVPILWDGWKYLDKEVEKLKQENEELRYELDELKAMIGGRANV